MDREHDACIVMDNGAAFKCDMKSTVTALSEASRLGGDFVTVQDGSAVLSIAHIVSVERNAT